MNARLLLWLIVLPAIGFPVRGADLRQRSVSQSKQFIVFSSDLRLRQRVASYADALTGDVDQLLGGLGVWRTPIVITLDPASALERDPPAVLRLVDTPAGQKIEINVKIGNDPSAVNMQKLILRALLLEYSYRGVRIAGGAEYVEAPWWVVEGLLEMERRHAQGIDTDLFRRLVETNHLPSIENFLQEKPEAIGPTALAVDGALAMGLLQMFIEQPDGHANLARLVRHWPQCDGDAMGLLAKEFPALARNPQTLQKWWTVNLARFAAVDRYRGLTVEETDKALAPLLQIELLVNKDGDKKTFAVSEYAHFPKSAANRGALSSRHAQILELSTRANALMSSVVADYEQIFALLARGKIHGLGERLKKVEEYRAFVLHRTSEIADYLNWFEATQMKSRSGEFDAYLKTADEVSEQDRRQKNAISRYLDEIEQDF
jgi:hypothetical protein